MPRCSEAEAAAVVGRLRARTPSPYSCSVGLAIWNGAESADRLMIRADSALYDAKRAGRGRAAVARLAS
jgi:GGDEF domain-containing protein